MPAGTAPPDPWTDPRGYLVWYHDQLQQLAAEGDMRALATFIQEQEPTIDKLRQG